MKSILIVEDHDETRELTAKALREAGFEVSTCASCEKALDVLAWGREADPGVLVLDLVMPGMSGWDFLSILKSYHRLANIPVIVTSAVRPSTALHQHTIREYFPKPVDLPALLAKIREVLTAPDAGSAGESSDRGAAPS